MFVGYATASSTGAGSSNNTFIGNNAGVGLGSGSNGNRLKKNSSRLTIERSLKR